MILAAAAQVASDGVDVTDTGPPLWIFIVILAILLVPYLIFLARRYHQRLPPDLPWDGPSQRDDTDPGAS